MTINCGKELWREQLLVGISGNPKPLLANAITLFREAMPLSGVLAYNSFAQETWLVSSPPWHRSLSEWRPRAWAPQDDLFAAEWCQRQGISVGPTTAGQAAETVARDNEFNPVFEYLETVTHDCTPRLDTWLSVYLGAPQTDYSAAVGRAALIAAVARAMNPGCKADTMLILEGPQGARKSTAIKTLAEPWFTDELADLGSKDAAMQLRGAWIIEVSELDAMSRGEISKIKAFISRTTDRFRPPYGARVIESPRSCVFWGTTNAEGYLKDETGGRRFWPVTVGEIDIDALGRDRDQLWAEARVLFDAGAAWWITNPRVLAIAQQQQGDRYASDPWDADISAYCSGEGEVTIARILRDALGIEKSRWGQLEQNRVARCLQSMGYRRHQRRSGDRREWVYRKPVTERRAPAVDGFSANVTAFPSGDTRRPVTAETAVPQALA